MEKIKYKNLSNWLKVAVVGMWIFVGFEVLGFLLGFLVGLTS